MAFGDYLQFVMALGTVLGLIAGLTWLVKRFGFSGALRTQPPRGERLTVVETQPLDARRKLVLLRRDGVEHLVLLGLEHDLLIESGIAAVAEAREQTPNPAPAGPISLRTAKQRAAETLAKMAKVRA